jgi:hypothetical protein
MRKTCPICNSLSFKVFNGVLEFREGQDFIPLDGKPFESRLTMIGQCNICGSIFDSLED